MKERLLQAWGPDEDILSQARGLDKGKIVAGSGAKTRIECRRLMGQTKVER
jgi:hypothetical protein